MKEGDKERFNITLEDDLLEWIKELIEDKTFSSRVHAISFCVSEMKKIGIENIMMIKWGKIKPLYLSETEMKIVKRISERLDISEDEAAKLLFYKGFETIEQEAQKE